MRSFLFVPGDNESKFKRARVGVADALIIDLEDSVSQSQKNAAREITLGMLDADRNGQSLFVRVNAFDSARTLGDLAAVMPSRPDGIVLPKCASATDVKRLSSYLDAFEAAAGHEIGATRIIGIATETAESMWGLGSYKGASPRLWGLMWGGEDLAASLGATENNLDGAYTSPFVLARNLCLMGAATAGVVAIDTVSTRIKDLEHVENEARDARRDGFGAKAVIHPSHVEIVNRAFAPTEAEAEWARRVVTAFREDSSAGVVTIDGRMIDKPHERAAQKILAALRR